MTRPRLLDLFCGAGGAAMGYHQAGFQVVGVDISPQPNYPFEFWQADAIEVLRDLPRAFHELDVIHASPPCQAYTSLRTSWNAGQHPRLIESTRDLLTEIGLPWVMENVPQSPLNIGPPSLFSDQSGIYLCGTMFGLSDDAYELRRHRLFESNVPLAQPECRHSGRTVVGFYGDHVRIREVTTGEQRWGRDVTRRAEKLAFGRTFMGIDWMEWRELAEAIPPVYTKFIGEQLVAEVRGCREGR